MWRDHFDTCQPRNAKQEKTKTRRHEPPRKHSATTSVYTLSSFSLSTEQNKKQAPRAHPSSLPFQFTGVGVSYFHIKNIFLPRASPSTPEQTTMRLQTASALHQNAPGSSTRTPTFARRPIAAFSPKRNARQRPRFSFILLVLCAPHTCLGTNLARRSNEDGTKKNVRPPHVPTMIFVCAPLHAWLIPLLYVKPSLQEVQKKPSGTPPETYLSCCKYSFFLVECFFPLFLLKTGIEQQSPSS